MASLARILWTDNADLAEASLSHPFVRGIGDGSLARESFAGYVAQDAFFLDAFIRAYALALAHAPDRAGVLAFADLAAGVRDELRLHESYARQWDVDLSAVRPAPATLAYRDFLLATAALGSLGDTCAAMTPCMRLYAYLGRSLAGAPHAETYAEWIDTYAHPDFEALAVTLEGLLDRYVDDQDSARAAYRRAMRLELDFFDSAHQPSATRLGVG